LDGVELRLVEAIFIVHLLEQFPCNDLPPPVGLLEKKQKRFGQRQAVEKFESRFQILGVAT
jgi:hypothetical protein